MASNRLLASCKVPPIANHNAPPRTMYHIYLKCGQSGLIRTHEICKCPKRLGIYGKTLSHSFDFSNIPKYIENGSVDIPGWSGQAYCDTELTTIDLNPPVPDPNSEWVATVPVEQTCKTMGEPEVVFTKYRWDRGSEAIEYWFGEYDLGIDMFFVHRNGDDFTVINCITGHPGIVTPAIDWGNSDGSTDAPKIDFDTVDELIENVYRIGIEFVEDQQH